MGEVTRHYAGHWPVGDRAGPFKMTFVFNSMYNEKSNIAIHERGGPSLCRPLAGGSPSRAFKMTSMFESIFCLFTGISN